MRVTSEALNVSDNLRNLEPALRSAIDLLESTTRWLIEDHRDNQSLMAIVAVNFLMGAGTCIAGWLLAKSALIAQEKLAEDTEFYGAKITTCQFFSAHVMPRTQSYLDAVRSGEQSGLLLEGDQY